MKKRGKPILLTLLILVGITVAGIYFLTMKEDGPQGEMLNRMHAEQSDIESSRAYQYDISAKAEELATSGENKNVLCFDKANAYSVATSNAARARLDRLIKRTDAGFESPIIALNPFATNDNTFYFYFETSSRYMVRYTVTVEDETISDHVRYVNNGQENNMSKVHEFVVSGLVPGRENYIIIELLDSTGAKRESRTYKYRMPAYSAPGSLAVEQGYSKDTSKTGMYFVLPKGMSQILCYDNKGILRNVTNTETNHGRRFYQSYDSVLYQVADNKVAKVSRIGQVTGVVQINGYGKIKDFSYDGYQEVYSVGTKKGRDYLLATAFDTGKTRVVYKFKKGVSIGSLSTPQAGGMMLTTTSPNGVVVMNAITSANPEVSYVLGSKKAWKGKMAKKKIKEDDEVTLWNTGQSLLNASVTDSAMWSLMTVRQGKVTSLSWTLNNANKEIKVNYRFPFGGNAANQSQMQGDHTIYTDVAGGIFQEYDKDGKGIRKMSFGKPVDAVVKATLGDMCFFGI